MGKNYWENDTLGTNRVNSFLNIIRAKENNIKKNLPIIS